MRTLDGILRHVLLASLAATAACGADDSPTTSGPTDQGPEIVPGSRIATIGLSPIACTPDVPYPGVTPSSPASYVEIRTRDGSGDKKLTRGVLCENAIDRPKCESDYAALRLEADEKLIDPGAPVLAQPNFALATDASGLRVFRTLSELSAWILPVDSEGDALMAAYLAGYGANCENLEQGAVGRSGEEYRVVAIKRTRDCDPVETSQFLLAVKPDGTVTPLENHVLTSQKGVCVGREPEGLVAKSDPIAPPVGRWLAEIAYLERASVASFERMAEELTRFGAPASLIEAARCARADEVRHAAMMDRLAEQWGACVPAQDPLAFGERSLEAFALENAVEGCTFETFGALLGLAQAEIAADPHIRATMRRIAVDETRHGDLAWRVHEWALARLDAAAVARIESSRQEALASLLTREDDIDADAARTLGLPTRPLRRELTRSFVAALS